MSEFVFFSGGGLSAAFYVGIYKKMSEVWGYEGLFKAKYLGNSAGALMSFLILSEKKYQDMDKLYLTFLKDIEKTGIFGNVSNYINDVLNSILVNEDDYKKYNYRLYIGLTEFPLKYKIIYEWKNNQELIDTLHASMHIPFYSTHTKKINNKIYIDGAVWHDYQFFNDDTITISKWNKLADINLNNILNYNDKFFNLKKENYCKLFDLGYQKCEEFLNKEDVIIKKNYEYSALSGAFYITVTILFWILRYIQELIILIT